MATAARTATASAAAGAGAGADVTVADDPALAARHRPKAGILRTAMAAVGGLLLLGVVAALVAASLEDGDSPSAGPGGAGAVTPATSRPADTVTPTTAVPAPPTTTTAAAVAADPAGPPPEGAQPGPLDDLIARLAADPQAAGERGDDLLEELEEVRDADPEVRTREAVEAVSRARRWTRQGDLEPGVTEQVDAVLVAAIGRDLLDGLDRPDRADGGGDGDGGDGDGEEGDGEEGDDD
jgi:hypothetical protein